MAAAALDAGALGDGCAGRSACAAWFALADLPAAAPPFLIPRLFSNLSRTTSTSSICDSEIRSASVRGTGRWFGAPAAVALGAAPVDPRCVSCAGCEEACAKACRRAVPHARDALPLGCGASWTGALQRGLLNDIFNLAGECLDISSLAFELFENTRKQLL